MTGFPESLERGTTALDLLECRSYALRREPQPLSPPLEVLMMTPLPRRWFLVALVALVAFAVSSPLLVVADEAPATSKKSQRETGIAYRTGDVSEYAKERCLLDLSIPEGVKDFPTVVWFHGGGLTGGERSIPSELERQGIAVAAAGYRLSPKAKSPEYVEDAAAAVAWTFKNIASRGGSPEKIYVAGHSAGAYLSLMVTLDRKWLAAHDIDANRIAGVISDSSQTITHFTVRKERGIGEFQPVIDDMAPLYHVRKDSPPLLLITGDRDLELRGRYEENAYLWRMMKEVGHTGTTLLELDGFNHGEMVRPAHPLLLKFVKKPRS